MQTVPDLVCPCTSHCTPLHVPVRSAPKAADEHSSSPINSCQTVKSETERGRCCLPSLSPLSSHLKNRNLRLPFTPTHLVQPSEHEPAISSKRHAVHIYPAAKDWVQMAVYNMSPHCNSVNLVSEATGSTALAESHMQQKRSVNVHVCWVT